MGRQSKFVRGTGGHLRSQIEGPRRLFFRLLGIPDQQAGEYWIVGAHSSRNAMADDLSQGGSGVSGRQCWMDQSVSRSRFRKWPRAFANAPDKRLEAGGHFYDGD